MVKKLTLLAMAVAALVAFAAPSMASAEVTDSGGSVALGTVLTGTSSNTTTETSIGTLKCENVTVSAALTENSGANVQAKSSGSGTTKNCEVPGLGSLEITEPKLETLKSTSSGSGTVNLHFVAHVSILTCTFTGSNVPFTYTPNTNVIHVHGTITGSGFLCPASGTFDGSYTIEDAKGGVRLS